MKSGENYYLHSQMNKPKKLSKAHGITECLAFDPQYCTETSTKSFLFATSAGHIYEMIIENTGKEKLFQLVYQLDQSISISSIHFDRFQSETGGEPRTFIMFSTAKPTRIYQFNGVGNFSQLFSSNNLNSSGNNFIELPGDISKPELIFYRNKSHSRVPHFALMTGVGIYYGSLLFGSKKSR